MACQYVGVSSNTSKWSRREFLGGWAGSALQPRLDPLQLSGFYYRDYSKCLPDYLAELARKAYEKRKYELSLLTSPDAIRRRQVWVRETFWKLIGGRPEPTPLNARVTGHFEREGYGVDKVVYQSQPGVFVSANLYIPTSRKPPHPGVLFQMGHYYSGKAYATYQKCCQGLARLGYMVLAFDPMGQGERINYPDSSGTNTRLSSADEEHNLPGKQFLLLGNSATRYQVWDAIRSLDFLASHPLVDAGRLAATGQSGGATLTMLLACADDRLSAAAISSGNTENFASAKFHAPGSTDDAEQDFINSGPAAFDRWDLLYPLAPKPLLVEISAHDFFGTYSPGYLDDGREQFENLAKVYQICGHPDQLGWNSTPMPHGLSYSLRLGIYNWFERWLMNSEQRISQEPPVIPEPEQTLWTGQTGNVTRDFGSLRPFDWVRSQAAVTPRNSSIPWQISLPKLELRKLSEVPLGGVRLVASELNSASGVWIPVWAFIPENSDAGQAPLLILDDRGRNTDAGEGGLYHRLSRAGRRVFAADIRGMGDCRPEVAPGNPAYTIEHDQEEAYAWSSLILGASLLAQRMADILALGHAIGPELSIAARGRLTVPALFAFAESKVALSLYLVSGLVSFQSVLETEDYQHPLANFSWNLFSATDLPLLAARCAPRRIHLAGAVDGANNLMGLDTLRKIYPGDHVKTSTDPAWNQSALAAL